MLTKSKTQLTKEQFLQAIQKIEDDLYDYNLYGIKENLDSVRDILPDNVKPIEIPKDFLLNESELYLINRYYLT